MDPAAYRQMLALQDTHWWFRTRRRILSVLLQRFVPVGDRVLEVGAGTGANLPLLARWGAVTALEPSRFAADHLVRHYDVEVVRGAVPSIQTADLGEFHLIAALDVLEHIDDDDGALGCIAECLRPGGWLLITVPAFAFLWSSHDEALHHKRRYRLPALLAKLDTAGFAVAYGSYYNGLLFLPALAIRLADRVRRGSARAGATRTVAPLDRLLEFVFGLETKLIGRLGLPFGLSIVVLARKPD
ncbi:MAG: class I SAM-dependent methyltransferase [Gammaproteobacteria bacterium]|nr:class I SAM-dependent methyltransferase [Gammaproteobacteria bacterium]MDE0440522.1 class I SAM-dependent methyltransferase [Gammaproteobacteria bacterium]